MPNETLFPTAKERTQAIVLTAFCVCLGGLSAFSGFFQDAPVPISRLWLRHPTLMWKVIDVGVTAGPALISVPLILACISLLFDKTPPVWMARALGVVLGVSVFLWQLTTTLSMMATCWPFLVEGSFTLGLGLFLLSHVTLVPLAMVAFRDEGRQLLARAIQSVAALHFSHWCIMWFYAIARIKPALWTFWTYPLLAIAAIAVSEKLLLRGNPPGTLSEDQPAPTT